MKLSYLNLVTTDPRYNLATEQYIFDCLPRNRVYFMLWQNDNAVIIGRHQNTLAEINETYVRTHHIQVVRRISGGGAVYHDMGNLNFTIITDADQLEDMNFRVFCEPVLAALSRFGVYAQISGRNDITISGRKFSGNAQYISHGRIMHHGTILFDSDLSAVAQALRVDDEKISTKGIRSVRSRVTNVSEHIRPKVSLQEFRTELLKQVLQNNSGTEYHLESKDLTAVQQLVEQRYSTWNWNYGVSPPCTFQRCRRVENCGLIDVRVMVEHGVITQIAFLGDFFSIHEPEELTARFLGKKPDSNGFAAAIKGIDISQYFVGLSKETFLKILTAEE